MWPEDSTEGKVGSLESLSDDLYGSRISSTNVVEIQALQSFKVRLFFL